MQLVTEYAKRRNTIKLSLNTKKKKMIQTVYRSPENKLVKRLSFTGDTVEEIALIYLRQLNKYSSLGYEIKKKKNGKVLTPSFKK
ncbi:MAG: hypothetical protein GX327_09890 [Epulopiscium sp.]|jgi:hypothetical protein|nr:hypothetical protein [Candidatus Epulonipiscium sp.]